MTFDPFTRTQLIDYKNNWYQPIAVMNREVIDFLEMIAEYVFKNMSSEGKYTLKYYEPTRVEVIEDEIIKLN